MVARIKADLLLAKAIARPSAEWNEVSTHRGIDVTKPSLREEFERFWVDDRIAMHKVGGHANGDLLEGYLASKLTATVEAKFRLTPTGIVHRLYLIGTSGETRGSLCMTP
jgi:hypothetical protein